MTRTLLKRTLLIGGLCLLALALWQMPLIIKTVRFNPVVWPSFQGTPDSVAQANVQDVRFLRRFTDYDRSYSSSAKKAFDTYLDEVEARAAKLTAADLYLAASRAAALSNNAHTAVSGMYLLQKFNHVGVRFYWFEKELYVVRAQKEYHNLLGARVLEIEGRPVDEVVNNLSNYFGGVPSWRQLRMLGMLESPELMHSAGLATNATGLRMDLALANGETMSTTLAARAAPRTDFFPDARIKRRPSHSLIPSKIGTEEADWRSSLHAVAPEQIAPYLREAGQAFHASTIPAGMYLQLNQTLDAEKLTLEAFVDKTLGKLAPASLDTMVIDLRWNTGGDFTQFVPLIPKLLRPLRAEGRMYVLVGPQTFSAAIVAAAMLRIHAAPRAIIVGEEMGDGGVFWAETGLPFRLPNSRIGVNYSTGYHDWLVGCEEHPYCFTETIKHGVKAGNLEPTVKVALRYEDYAAGRDSAMEWVLEEIGSQKRF